MAKLLLKELLALAINFFGYAYVFVQQLSFNSGVRPNQKTLKLWYIGYIPYYCLNPFTGRFV